MLTGLLLCALVVLKGFPETDAAQWLDRTVQTTLAAARRVERHHIIFLILMTVLLAAGTELLAIGGPFDMALVLMWDVSAYIDIVLTTIVVAGATRSSAGLHAIVARVSPRRASRAKRQRSVKKATPPANDDDRAVLALAA